jgi:hypothetical protein
MIQRQFYEELGKLLYVIAKADGIIQQQEIAEIKKIIYRELSQQGYFKAHPDARAMILIKLSFEDAIRKSIHPLKAWKSFTYFMETGGVKVNTYQKEFALDLITRIVHAYKGVNKAEAKLLQEVRNLLLSGSRPGKITSRDQH